VFAQVEIVGERCFDEGYAEGYESCGEHETAEEEYGG